MENPIWGEGRGSGISWFPSWSQAAGQPPRHLLQGRPRRGFPNGLQGPVHLESRGQCSSSAVSLISAKCLRPTEPGGKLVLNTKPYTLGAGKAENIRGQGQGEVCSQWPCPRKEVFSPHCPRLHTDFQSLCQVPRTQRA